MYWGFLSHYPKGAFNNYVDKMRGSKNIWTNHAQGIKTVQAGGLRGWKGPFNTFSKTIFSKKVSIDQNWPNDQILCMDQYLG